MAQRSTRDGQVEHVHFAREREVAPVPADRAEFHADVHRPRPAAFQQSAGRFEDERVGAGLFHEQVRDAAGGVAAGGDLAPVDVEDAHPGWRAGVGSGGGGRLDGQQLIAADPDPGIADAYDVGLQEGAPVRPPVEDDEMIAQAVHLAERPFGIGRSMREAGFQGHLRFRFKICLSRRMANLPTG